jgi:hypothetical protein
MTHHECPDVIRLTVGHTGYSELLDEILGRIQVLEPLISGDGVLGCLHGSDDRRVSHYGGDLVLSRALPDPALNHSQGLPDHR